MYSEGQSVCVEVDQGGEGLAKVCLCGFQRQQGLGVGSLGTGTARRRGRGWWSWQDAELTTGGRSDGGFGLQDDGRIRLA